MALESFRVSDTRLERFLLSETRKITERTLMDLAPLAGVNAQITLQLDVFQNMVLSLHTWILKGYHPAQQREQVVNWETPATWWEHLKLAVKRRVPWRWWRFLPVRMDKFSRTVKWMEGPTYVCPHANVKWPDGVPIHIRFLEKGPEG